MTLDKYYTALQEEGGTTEDFVNAGWMTQSPTIVPYDVEQYTTPVSLLTSSEEEHISVLFYPGCFAPIHEGHIKAMELAKEAVEKATGETVVAGYYAPDNDKYVMRKTNNDKRFQAEKRINIIHQKTVNQSWTRVHSWPALHAESDLNFTIYYDQLLAYLNHWVPDKKIKLYMVFGQDNALFANAFTKHGYGVCIRREGTSVDLSTLRESAKERTIFSLKSSTNQSSTAIRKTYPKEEHKQCDEAYVIRDDIAYARKYGNPKITDEYLLNTIKTELETATGYKVTVVQSGREERKSNLSTISLDCFWGDHHKLEMTRLFDAADSQIYSNFYINRPGKESILQQIQKIPVGEYVLVDDDIATGKTMDFATNILDMHGISIKRRESLLGDLQGKVYDVVDARDFILGANHGGLTVRAPEGRNRATRMPYMYPYVNLTARAKVSPEKILKLSSQMWLMNAELFKNSGVTVGDIKHLQDFTAFKFDEKMLIEDVCLFHAKMSCSSA